MLSVLSCYVRVASGWARSTRRQYDTIVLPRSHLKRVPRRSAADLQRDASRRRDPAARGPVGAPPLPAVAPPLAVRPRDAGLAGREQVSRSPRLVVENFSYGLSLTKFVHNRACLPS